MIIIISVIATALPANFSRSHKYIYHYIKDNKDQMGNMTPMIKLDSLMLNLIMFDSHRKLLQILVHHLYHKHLKTRFKCLVK